MSGGFFLSYRHGGDDGVRRAICGRLVDAFGAENVISDETFAKGGRLRRQVQEAIERSVAFLALVDSHWLNSLHRVHAADDWVRVEISHGLKLRLPIIPLCVNGSRLPIRGAMPEDVCEFVECQGHNVDTSGSFDDAMNTVIRSLTLIRRGHVWAQTVYDQVNEYGRRGDWTTALDTIEQALASARKPGGEWQTENRVFPVLQELKDDLALLAEASEAFQAGHFEHVRTLLAEIRDSNDAALLGCHAADIGVSAARALHAGDGGGLAEQRIRLESLVRSVRGKCAVPGAAHVHEFLATAQSIINERASLEQRAMELHHKAVHPFAAYRGFVPGGRRMNLLESVPDAVQFIERASGDKFIEDVPEHAKSNAFGPATQLGSVHYEFDSIVKMLTSSQPEVKRAMPWVYKLVDWTRSEFAVPGGNLGKTEFTIVAPEAIEPGQHVRVSVWAHRAGSQNALLRRSRDAWNHGEPEEQPRSPLTARLRSRDLRIVREDEPMLWRDSELAAVYDVSASPSARGTANAVVEIGLHGLRTVRLRFSFEVRRGGGDAVVVRTTETRHRSAFASFAEADEHEVRRRLLQVSALAPELTVHDRCLELRKESSWPQAMRSVIARQDVFYLFWSSAAQASADVEREWRAALQEGSDFLNGIALDGEKRPRELHDVPFHAPAREPGQAGRRMAS
jgi:TIR domain